MQPTFYAVCPPKFFPLCKELFQNSSGFSSPSEGLFCCALWQCHVTGGTKLNKIVHSLFLDGNRISSTFLVKFVFSELRGVIFHLFGSILRELSLSELCFLFPWGLCVYQVCMQFFVRNLWSGRDPKRPYASQPLYCRRGHVTPSGLCFEFYIGFCIKTTKCLRRVFLMI